EPGQDDLAPLFVGLGGMLYGAVAVAGGAGMLWLAIDIFRTREGKPAVTACWRMFGFSILYLFGLFAAILAERMLLPLIRVTL
ncbi:MAG: hypothetical protein LCH61_16720, partial [Proteobacteria bacterium]|nr:hypothetical protein [Pseudomonadota bacterium]